MLTDKRVVKTRSAVKTAFMQLILEKELGKITVSNITEKAQINRSTFYLHYNDVYAVMKDIENEIEAKISSCIDNFDIRSVYESTFAMFTSLTDMLNETTAVKNFILNSTSSDYLTGRLKEIITDKTKSAMVEAFPELDPDKLDYPLTFAAAGIIDTYVKWAHDENKSNSLEELIKTVSIFVKYILEYIRNNQL